jgi:hypothetical protein
MTGVESTRYTIGQRVTMTWAGGTRDGLVVGAAYADSLPTGARFVPVQWHDGTTSNVDTRVLSVTAGSFAECPDCGGHLYMGEHPIDGLVWACEGDECDTWGVGVVADADLYLEHGEHRVGREDDTGRVALYIVRTDECSEVDL